VVQVRSDCGPVAGAVVRFTVHSGAVADAPGGLGVGQTTVDITTGASGLDRAAPARRRVPRAHHLDH
jgi:hypothetical protein